MRFDNRNACGIILFKKFRIQILALIFIVLSFLLFSSSIMLAQSEPVEVGYRTLDFGNHVLSEPTGEKPESKLWWNDGYWWGSLWDPDSRDYEIHRFELDDQEWISTNTTLDTRGETLADALWDGSKLYIASHFFTSDNPGTTSDANSAKLYRYSYNPSNKTYSQDAGFPVQINQSKSETLVLAKDSAGKLWITWTQNGDVMINCSDGNDLNWGTPFKLPAQDRDVADDDISSVIAFDGSKIGIMWSNQDRKKMHFAVHLDSDSANVWQDEETVLHEPGLGNIADDHINMATACDNSGNIYAVTKTSLGQDEDDPLTMVLHREPDGDWHDYEYGTVEYGLTRAVLLIDDENQQLYVFAASNNVSNQQDAIYYKVTDLDDINFESGLGTPFILSDDDQQVNNPTSTKQCINGQTGLLVLASDKSERTYLHNYLDINRKPIVTSFSPELGPANTTVTLTGKLFSGATSIVFNETPTNNFVIVSPTEIQVIIPQGATSGPITVINSEGGTPSLEEFTVTIPPFDLTMFTNGPGSISLNPPGGSYTTVTDVTVTAVADNGYVFAGWDGDLQGFDNPQTLTMNTDRTIFASFVEDFAGQFPELEEVVSGTAFEEKQVSTTEAITKVNHALYLAAISNQDNEDVEAVTGLGLEWSRVDAQCGGRGDINLEVWMAQGEPFGSGIVTAFFDKEPDGSVIAVSRYSKIDFVNPIGTVVSKNDNGIDGDCDDGDRDDRYSFDLQTTDNASVIYSVAGMRHRTHEARNGFEEYIEVASGNTSNDAGIAVMQKEISNPSDEEVEGRFSDDVDYSVIGIEIKKGSGGTGGNLFSLAVNQTGHGIVTLNPNKPAYEDGETVVVSAEPASGYRFNNWSGDASGTSTLTTITIEGDSEITAHFLAQYTLSVTEVGRGAVQIVPEMAIYDSATVVALNATPEPGYRFTGWTGDTLSEASAIVLNMKASRNLIATFVPVYTLTTNIFGFGTISFDPPPNAEGVYDSAQVVAVSAIPDSGHIFVGWSGDFTSQDQVILLVMDGDKTLNATFVDWTSQIFTVNVQKHGVGTIIIHPPGGIYGGGTSVTITALPEPNHAFTGWSGDLTGLENPVTILVNENKDIVADFFPRYALDVNVVGPGTLNIDPPGGIYDSAAVVQLTAIPQPGFIFNGWSGDENDLENPKNLVMDTDKSLTATFVTQYSVTTNVEEGGRILLDPPNSIYGEGTEVSFAALPDPGFIFDHWSGDLSGNQNPKIVTLASDIHAVAEFTTLDALDLDSLLDISVNFADAQLRNSVSEIDETDRFPRGTKEDGTWETKSPNEWVSGFFPGALWILYKLSDDADFKNWAEERTEELESQKNNDNSHEIGFKVFLSFGNGYELTGNEAYKAVILEAAQTMASRYNPTVGAIQSWNNWHFPITIESLATLEMLLWGARNGGDQAWYDMAVSHGLKVKEDFVRPDGSVYEIIDYDENDGDLIDHERDRSESTETTWSAGQAWAIYGFTMLYRETGDSRFLEAAQQTADYFIANLPSDLVPYWDFNAPLIPDTEKDVTATAIAAAALQELGSFVTDPFAQLTYQTTAYSMLQALSAPPYIAEGSNSSGILLHAVRNHPDERDVDVSLIYADYYFLEAIRRFKSQPKVLYNLSMNLSGDGEVAINPQGVSFPSGTEVTLSATPAFRHEFSGWSGDLSGIENPVTITMDSHKDITAIFTELTNQKVVFTEINGAGNILLNPPGGIYEVGTTVTLTAVPAPGGLFDGWGGALSGTQNPQTIVISEDVTVSASFISRYSLTVNDDPNGSIIISPELDFYDEGTPVTLIAIPSSGYQFNSWSGDLNSSDNPTTIIMDADKIITPLFIPDAATHLNTYTGTSEDEVFVSTDDDVPASPENFYLASIVTRNNFNVSSVSGLGLTWTQLKARCAGRNQTTAEVWMGQGTPTGDDKVTASFASDPPRAIIAVSVYTGVDLSDPVGSIVSWNTNGIDGGCSGGDDTDEYAFNITPTVDGSIIYVAAATRDESNSPGDGYTEHVEESVNSGSRKITLAIQDQALTTNEETVVDGSLSDNADMAIIAIEIKPGDTGGISPVASLTAQTIGEGSLTVTPDPISGTPPGGIYDIGATVTLTATPAAGYEFAGWSGDLNGDQNPATIVMDEDKTIIATFEVPPPPEHTLTINIIGSGSVNLEPVPNSGTNTNAVYFEGTEVTLTAVPDPGFEFAGWGNHLSGNNSSETLTINSDKNVLAIFAELPPEEYTLTVTPAGPGTFTLDPPGGVYIEGTEVTITAVADSGYEFSGWGGDTNGTENPLTITMDSDKNITGAFTELPPQFYTLETNTLGSGILVVSPQQDSYAEGTGVLLIAAPFSGYEFVGWSGDASGTNFQTTLVMNSNKSVTAVFWEVGQPRHSLTVNTIGSGNVTLDPPDGFYSPGTVVTLTGTPATGFLFGGWSGDLSGTNNPQTLVLNSDKTVTAAFTEIPPEQYTVTVNSIGSGTITLDPPGGTYAPGTNVTLTAVPASGYLFTTWSGDLGGSANPQSINVNSDKNISAVFIEEPAEQFTLTVNTTGSGNVILNPPGGVYDAGAVVSLAAVAESGHQFSGWGGELSGTTNPQSITIDSDKTVTAAFTEVSVEEFNLNLTVTGSGEVVLDPAGGVYPAGTAVTLTAVPESGHQFNSWNGDLSGTTNPQSITIDSDKTVSATFTQVSTEQFNLNITAIGGGEVELDPPGGVYPAGTTVTLTAVPGSGNQFGGWGGDLSGTINPSSVTVNSDKNIIAAFTSLPAGIFSLTIEKIGSGNVTLNPPGGIYSEGAVVTLTAVPGAGFQFNTWSGDLNGATTSQTLTMDAHKTVTAEFSEIAPTQFALTINVTGLGSVTLDPPGGNYDAGTVVTLTAAADSGYLFNGWSGDLSGVLSPATITMDSDKTISAEFIELPPEQYTLNVNVVGSGMVMLNPPGGTYDAGTVVTLTAAADPGYLFAGWGGDLSGLENPQTIVINTDKSVTSNFIEENTGGGGGGPVVYEETVSGGATLTDIVSTAAPITGVSGDLYIATISTREPVDIIAVNGLDLNWSLIKAQCSARGKTNLSIWVATGNPVGDGVVTANLAEATDNIVITVSRYSGIDAANPIGMIVSGNTLGEDGPCSGGEDNAAYSFNISTNTQNAMVYGAIAHRNRHNTPGAGYTEHGEYQQDGTTGGAVAGMSTQEQSVAAPANLIFDGTLNRNVDWAVVAFEIRSGGNAGGGTTQYSLTANVNGSGSITANPPGNLYDEGNSVTLTAIPDSGYEFSGWSGDLSGTNNPATVVMDSDKTVTATFTEIVVPQFTISTNVLGSGSIALEPPGGVYNTGTVVTFTAIPETGFQFTTWSGDLNNNTNPQTLTIDSDKTITAVFTELPPGQFSLNTTISGSGSVALNPPGGVYDAGTVVTLTAIPDSGFQFDTWSGDLSGSTNPDTIVVDSDKDVTAEFTEIPLPQYSLNLSTIGEGSVVLDPPGGIYDAGTVVTLTATPNSGYQFDGWSGDLSGTTNPATITMDTDKSITTNFIEQTGGGGGGPVVHEETVSGGVSALTTVSTANAITAASDNLYLATIATRDPVEVTSVSGLGLNWSLVKAQCSAREKENVAIWMATGNPGGSGIVSATLAEATENVVITVSRFSGVDASNPIGQVIGGNTLGLDGACSGGVDNAAYSFNITSATSDGLIFGAIAHRNRRNTPGAGYTEYGEYEQDGSTGGNTLRTSLQGRDMATPATIAFDGVFNRNVDWAVIALEIRSGGSGGGTAQYNLTTNTIGSGSISSTPSGSVFDEGMVVLLTATPAAGFEFTGWSGDLSGDTNPASTVMNSDKSITANFSEIVIEQYNLTVNVEGAGNVTLDPPGGIYDDGSIVTLTATPDSGYQFSGWSGDLSGSNNSATITMDGNKTITATFSEISTEQYTLSVVTIGDGSVSLDPSGGTYNAGAVVTLTAVPAQGYEFSAWGGDLIDTANPITITMNSDKSIAAAFVEVPPEQFTVTTTISGLGTITLDPSGGTYNAGTIVTLTATPDNGYEFNEWSGDLSGSDNPATITVTSDQNITATFIDQNVTQYTLNTLPVGSGNILLDPPGETYAEGTVVTCTATPDAGFQFSGWGGNLSGFENPNTLIMNGNKTVIAAFTELPQIFFTLSTNVDGPGSVTLEPPGGTYQIGTTVAITATPNTGAQFDGWSGSLSGDTNPETLTMTANQTVTASFSEIDTSGGGSSGPVVYEETVTGGATELNVVSTSGNVTAASGDLYLTAVVTKNRTDVLSVEGLGLNWSLVKAQCSARSQNGVEIWMAMGNPSGDGVVSATLASSPSNSIIAVSRYSGVDSSTPLGMTISGNTLGLDGPCSGGVDNDAYAFNFNTTTDGAMIFGAIALRNRRHTSGANYTELGEFVQDGALGGDKATLAIQEQLVASPATVTLDGVFNKNVDWAVIGVEIRPGGAGTMAFIASDAGKIETPVSESETDRSSGQNSNPGRTRVATAGSQYYWKFNVQGVESRSITSVKLKLFVESGVSQSLSVYSVSNHYENSWSAWKTIGLNATSAPLIKGDALSTAAVQKTAGWMMFDVTPVISGSGEFSFALPAGADNQIHYLPNIEGRQPQLIVELGQNNSRDSEPGDIAQQSNEPQISTLSNAPVMLNQTTALPKQLILGSNYPEPFNPETTIEYALPADARVRLEVFNVLGQRMRVLVDEVQSAGFQKAVWEGKDEFGNEAASGVYFIQLTVGSEKLVGKMTLQK